MLQRGRFIAPFPRGNGAPNCPKCCGSWEEENGRQIEGRFGDQFGATNWRNLIHSGRSNVLHLCESASLELEPIWASFSQNKMKICQGFAAAAASFLKSAN